MLFKLLGILGKKKLIKRAEFERYLLGNVEV